MTIGVVKSQIDMLLSLCLSPDVPAFVLQNFMQSAGASAPPQTLRLPGTDPAGDVADLRKRFDKIEYVAAAALKLQSTLAAEMMMLADAAALREARAAETAYELIVASTPPVAIMRFERWSFQREVEPFKIRVKPRDAMFAASLGWDAGGERMAVMGYAKIELALHRELAFHEIDHIALLVFSEELRDLVLAVVESGKWADQKSMMESRRALA